MVKKKSPKERLGRGAWVDAALTAIGNEGVRGVRVEKLARTLGVTKGSFYWHFADRQALLDAVLDAWERVSTTGVIDRVEAAGGDGAARLSRLVAICFGTAEADRIEAGVRAWGASDDGAREVLERTDRRRLDYVTGLLVETGLKKPVARRRARILYLALIGDFTFRSHGGAETPRSVRDELVEMLQSPIEPRSDSRT